MRKMRKMQKPMVVATLVCFMMVALFAPLAKAEGTTSDYAGDNYKQEPVKQSYNNDDLMLLAKLIYAEARGESFEGKVAVGAVVLNRTHDPRFPQTIAGVIYEPWAFTCVYDGQFYMTPDDESIRAAQAALDGWDPTYGAVYYYNPAKTTSSWIYSRPVVTTIGSHVFAR